MSLYREGREIFKFVKKKIVGIALICMLLIGGVGYFIWDTQFRWELPVLKELPEVALPSISGETYTFQKSEKVKLVSFIFTHCPAICPMTTAEMAHVQKKLKETGVQGKEVEFVTITIDPVRDTPDVLRQYADQYHIDQSSWIFLRGTEEETKKTTLAFSFYAENMGDGDISHSTTTYLVDQENRIRAFHGMGNEFDDEQIIKDIMSLL